MNKEQMLGQVKKYGWIFYILCVIGYLATPFQRLAVAIMGPDLIKDLQMSATDFGLLGMTFSWCYAITNAPSGTLIDKIGSRKGLAMHLIVVAAGCFIFSSATTFGMALLGRIVTGCAIAGCFISGVKIISAWFPSKSFSGMYGLYMGLGALGGVGATAPLQGMMANFGWRSSFMMIAAGTVILAVIVLVVLRDRPEDKGLLSPDELTGETVAQAGPATDGDFWTSTKQVLKTGNIWLVGLFMLGVNSSGNVIVALWGGVFLSDVYHLTKPVIGEILTVSAFGLVAGSIAAGYLAKYIKHYGVMLSGSILFLIAWLYMAINLRTLGIMELKVIMGISGFTQMYAVVASFTLVRELVKPAQLGTAIGLANGFTWIFGAGAFQQIWGFIIDYVSKGVKPYPVEAFAAAIWMQLFTLILSLFCAIYFWRLFSKRAGTAN